jgi:predicted SAM-dependent methyltransferase
MIYADMIREDFKNILIFEIKSLLGRLIFSNRSIIPLDNQPVLLDLGAGQNFTNGWVHVNFFTGLNPLKNLFNKKKGRWAEVQMDLRYPINCPDNSVDGVYSSHTIEHLTIDDAKRMLCEIYRILKPGRYVRLIVPDLELYVKYYINQNDVFDFETGCEAIGSLTQRWGHKSVYDKIYLAKLLGETGFMCINKVEFGKEGKDKRLIKEKDAGKFESLVMEAQKPSLSEKVKDN